MVELCCIIALWIIQQGKKDKIMTNSKDRLKIAIQNGLAASECALNTKLKSEDRLVEILGVGRRYLRDAMNELVKDGILRRQRPNGTFLVSRPAPVHPENIPEGTLLNQQHILPEMLLEEEPVRSNVSDPIVSSRGMFNGLNIQFWGTNPWMGPSQHLYELGMMQTAMKLGVKLSFHVMEDEDGLLDRRKIDEQLRNDPAHAYIMPIEWREQVELQECFEKRSAPVIYMGSGSLYEADHTNVGFDAADTIERALDVFAKNGLKRIAMATIVKTRGQCDWHVQNLTECYRNFMRSRQLDYDCISFMDIQLNEVIETTGEILRRHRPEAIFVHDDFLLPGIALELKHQGLVPGRDIAVITISNAGLPLPKDYRWSTLEYDSRELGEQTLSAAALYAGGMISRPPFIWLKPRWIPGDTHVAVPDRLGNGIGKQELMTQKQ